MQRLFLKAQMGPLSNTRFCPFYTRAVSLTPFDAWWICNHTCSLCVVKYFNHMYMYSGSLLHTRIDDYCIHHPIPIIAIYLFTKTSCAVKQPLLLKICVPVHDISTHLFFIVSLWCAQTSYLLYFFHLDIVCLYLYVTFVRLDTCGIVNRYIYIYSIWD